MSPHWPQSDSLGGCLTQAGPPQGHHLEGRGDGWSSGHHTKTGAQDTGLETGDL